MKITILVAVVFCATVHARHVWNGAGYVKCFEHPPAPRPGWDLPYPGKCFFIRLQS